MKIFLLIIAINETLFLRYILFYNFYRTPATTLRVRVGEYNIREMSETLPHEEYSVRRKVVNEDYEPSTYRHDIALLELSHPVRFRKHIVPVCLPEKSENFTGRMATVTGWGRTSYGECRKNIIHTLTL